MSTERLTAKTTLTNGPIDYNEKVKFYKLVKFTLSILEKPQVSLVKLASYIENCTRTLNFTKRISN